MTEKLNVTPLQIIIQFMFGVHKLEIILPSASCIQMNVQVQITPRFQLKANYSALQI